MRLLHAADFHLDSPLAGLAPEKSVQRRRELREIPARLAALAQGAGVWQKIQETAQSNTALSTKALMPTYLTLAVLAVMDLLPTLLCCEVLRWGGKLTLALDADPFGGETVALAEELGVSRTTLWRMAKRQKELEEKQKKQG